MICICSDVQRLIQRADRCAISSGVRWSSHSVHTDGFRTVIRWHASCSDLLDCT